MKVSDLGPRDRFGLSFSVCTGFSASLALGVALRRGEGGGRGAFRDERLSLTAFAWGRHGAGVDGSGVTDVFVDFWRLTSVRV